MTPTPTPVVRPAFLWLGAALALPAALGMGATWTSSTAAIVVALGLLGGFALAWAVTGRLTAVSRQLTVGLVALAVLVVGVWTSGITGSLVPATGGAVAGALSAWLLSRASSPDDTGNGQPAR